MGLRSLEGPRPYRSLHINTSKPVMQYSDFPMRTDIPDFPHHTHVARYFDDYVDHFGFRDDITLDTTVEACRRTADGTWEVTLEGGETRAYDALVVANGHHWDAIWPDPPFPGSDTFEGRQMHSEEFVDAAPFTGQRVVVLGIGNSAMDISVETSYVADRVFLAARRGAYIVPNYLFGRPSDENLFGLSNHPRIPLKARFKGLGKKIELQQGGPRTSASRSPITPSARPIPRSRTTSSPASPTARWSRSRTSSGSRGMPSGSWTARSSGPTSSSTAPATGCPSPSSTIPC
jgi:cation diffusion facilitator CzcD-associated flavoprotein CzcO